MADISKELNSILNNDKNYDTEEESSKNFIFLLIIFVALTYFLILFLNSQEEKNESTSKNLQKEVLLKEPIKTEKKKIQNIIKTEKTVEIKKEQKEIQEIISKIDKTSFYKIYNSNNKKILKCYDYKVASFTPNKSCLESLEEFLDKNKDALRYQIVSVIAESDIIQYKKYNKNIQDLLLNGLSIKRITELTWYIKKYIKSDIIITSNNYYVKSKKNNRGIILKAYY